MTAALFNVTICRDGWMGTISRMGTVPDSGPAIGMPFRFDDLVYIIVDCYWSADGNRWVCRADDTESRGSTEAIIARRLNEGWQQWVPIQQLPMPPVNRIAMYSDN